jgi:plasmid stability protein
MEEEAREILRIALSHEDDELHRLSSQIHRRFAEIGGVDLRLPER